MANLHIKRVHNLGLEAARKIALQWQHDGEHEYGLTCHYLQSDSGDELQFKRSGISGVLFVSDTFFEMDASLGFLLSAFKERITREINQNLDELLGESYALK